MPRSRSQPCQRLGHTFAAAGKVTSGFGHHRAPLGCGPLRPERAHAAGSCCTSAVAASRRVVNRL
eukprot:9697402-Alexandrium_andersonii.AAC.1